MCIFLFFLRIAAAFLIFGVATVWINNAALTLGMTNYSDSPWQEAAAFALLALPVIMFLWMWFKIACAAKRRFPNGGILWLPVGILGAVCCIVPYWIMLLMNR